MPHLKCESCRIRLHLEGRRLGDVREDRCPRCQAPLERPGRLAELVGFQHSRFDGLLPDDNDDFLAALAIALTPPGTER